MAKNLDLYFGEDSEKIIDKEMTIHISKNGLCASFGIENERILSIVEINKCGFTGTELLERIELLAQDMYIPSIMLEDQSSVVFGIYKLDLGTLSIITKGRSWYNSKGYYSETHNIEKQEWELIRKSQLSDVFDHLLNISYEEYQTKDKGWYNDGLKLFCEINNSELDEENFYEMLKEFIDHLSFNFDCTHTVEKFGVDLSILSMNNSSEDYECLINLMMLSAISYAIRYTRHPLIKKI